MIVSVIHQETVTITEQPKETETRNTVSYVACSSLDDVYDLYDGVKEVHIVTEHVVDVLDNEVINEVSTD